MTAIAQGTPTRWTMFIDCPECRKQYFESIARYVRCSDEMLRGRLPFKAATVKSADGFFGGIEFVVLSPTEDYLNAFKELVDLGARGIIQKRYNFSLGKDQWVQSSEELRFTIIPIISDHHHVRNS